MVRGFPDPDVQEGRADTAGREGFPASRLRVPAVCAAKKTGSSRGRKKIHVAEETEPPPGL